MKCTIIHDTGASSNDINDTTNLKNMKQIKPKAYQLDSSYSNEYESDLDNLFNNFNNFTYNALFGFDNISVIITFDSPKKIKGIFLILTTNYGMTFTVYGSNNNKDFIELDKSSTINCGGYGTIGDCEIIIENKNKYKYYKFIMNETWNLCNCSMWLYTDLIDKYCIKNKDNEYYNILDNKKQICNIMNDTNMINSLPNSKIDSDIKIIKVSKEYKII